MSERSRFQTGGQTLLRQINLSAILNHIREEPPISRAKLAEKTGLNKATISSLVSELIDGQYVHEVGVSSNGVGRPRVMLSINPKAGFIVGAEVGVDFILVIATDFEPKQVFQKYQKIRSGEDINRILDMLVQQIQDAIDFCTEAGAGKFLGLAVGVPGLVDFAEGMLLFAPNLKWRNVPVRAHLRKHFVNVPVFVDNEANMATLGEYYFGSANKAEDALYLSAGVGLGGGILRGGRVLRGVVGMAGEFGHIIMDTDGELCACGNRGCWETQVSEKALYRYIRESLDVGQNSILHDFTQGDLSKLNVDMIVEAAEANDKVAQGALTRLAHCLGIGIASLINALNPELVVFGGILSTAWGYINPVIDADLKANVLLWDRQVTKVVLAKHGRNACVMGAVATVFQAVFSKPQNSDTSLQRKVAV
jgi:glucokinase-like ROK family protein